MKKLLTVLLASALLTGILAFPALAESKLLSWNGFEVWVTDYRYTEMSDDETDLHVDVRVSNNTSHQINLGLEDVMIDGTEIDGLGFFRVEPGANKTEWLLFKPNSNNLSGGSGAIQTGSQIDMTLVVTDKDTYEELYRTDASLNLYDLSVGGDYDDYDDDEGLDFGHGGASNANTAPAYTPASTDYQTLKKGSKGQAVKDLQQRLTDLRYLNDKVDGSYGTVTAIAVMSFCSQNGLYIQTEATPEMQRLLYSSSAQYYVEPYIPLVIGTQYKWYAPRFNNDVGNITIELVNRSDREIRGYEIYLYGVNMWGDKIVDDDGNYLYKYEEMQTFTGGRYQFSPKLYFATFAYTYTMYVGIHRIVFADGEVREVAYDDIIWFPCVVKNS